MSNARISLLLFSVAACTGRANVSDRYGRRCDRRAAITVATGHKST